MENFVDNSIFPLIAIRGDAELLVQRKTRQFLIFALVFWLSGWCVYRFLPPILQQIDFKNLLTLFLLVGGFGWILAHGILGILVTECKLDAINKIVSIRQNYHVVKIEFEQILTIDKRTTPMASDIFLTYRNQTDDVIERVLYSSPSQVRISRFFKQYQAFLIASKLTPENRRESDLNSNTKIQTQLPA